MIGPPKHLDLRELCPQCDTTVKNQARGCWTCETGHNIDYKQLLLDHAGDEEAAQNGLPYKDWGRITGRDRTYTAFVSIRTVYLLGLPVKDVSDDSLTVNMKHEAARAAFGPFGVEHQDTDAFFTAGATFSCNLFFATGAGAPATYATRCSQDA